MKALKPGQWEFFASFDVLSQRFKPNSFELSSNTRIEKLPDDERVYMPDNYTINGLPCGLNLRITRLGKIKMAMDSKLLINNKAQKSNFQLKMNGLCVHDPVINDIHKQALKQNKFCIPKPLLINSMTRIFNYKNSAICPQDTIQYAIQNKVWSQDSNKAIIQFDYCINQMESRIINNNNNQNDSVMVHRQFNNDNNNNANLCNALNFGVPQSDVVHRSE
eukprot:UN06033